jgi:hypothetical protein
MPVIVRDAVAAHHLVYAWPFPIGPDEHEVACADDEHAVMCPAGVVGQRLGPGRHRWRTPDPTRPVSAYFVRTAPVDVAYDMQTSFVIPATGQPVRLRASGSLQVRCGDPMLLIAQFVGLPFDQVNDGVMRSVSRSVERMLGKLLARRVVMAGTPQAVTDAAMMPSLLEELVAYNPTAGAVFGIELLRMGQLAIYTDDGSRPRHVVDSAGLRPNDETGPMAPPQYGVEPDLLETVRLARNAGARPPLPASNEPTLVGPPGRASNPSLSGEIPTHGARTPSNPHLDPLRDMPTPNSPRLDPHREMPTPMLPRYMAVQTPPRGVGMSTTQRGHTPARAAVTGDVPMKIAPGTRVLVPGPDGLMQSATVRQLLHGYLELEVGTSGDTIWVPMNGVVPE